MPSPYFNRICLHWRKLYFAVILFKKNNTFSKKLDDIYTKKFNHDKILILQIYFKGNLKIIFFYLGFTARHHYFTHFEYSQWLDGAKTEDPEKNYLTTRKFNLVCLSSDPNEAQNHRREMTSDLER